MIKTVVVSVLLLACFLVMADLVPFLLKNTDSPADNEQPQKKQEHIIKSIVLLVGIAIMITLILHFWH
ncbi:MULTISPECIES: hypothetical protein [unclassified Endozoicomonas]|uniref:hypothetical protein n=1 Tax=unclassified Endozoicomonas TaxID=2644528 RepID=UPI003BB7FED5